MTRERVAVLGGDAREAYIAGRLQTEGFEVSAYGSSQNGDPPVEQAVSAEACVRGARWIVCPSPGLGDGDRVYAPSSPAPIVLGAGLLDLSDARHGGLVLGRATPGVMAAAEKAGVAVFEMKDDRALAGANARAVAESLVSLLVQKSVRILPELHILVLGYGTTGEALTAALLGLSCTVHVAARRPDVLEAIAHAGAAPVGYDDRIEAMGEADVVVNTIPALDAIPESAFPQLGSTVVVDIASPPGGIDHEAARLAGMDVTWARGLAGARAPHSAGDAQLRFITRSMGAPPSMTTARHSSIPR